MTNRQRKVAEITIAGDWIRDTANNERIHDLYDEDEQFRDFLERLLQQREPRPFFCLEGTVSGTYQTLLHSRLRTCPAGEL